MENSIETVLADLYDMIQDAKGVLLSSDKCMIERDRALDMLDKVIDLLPEEIKSANTIISSRNELIAQAQKEAESTMSSARHEAETTLASARTEAGKIRANAKSEAESIVAKAKEKAQEMVTQEAVYQETEKQCKEMVDNANAKIAELKRVSNEYMNTSLRNTEEAIAAALKDVRETRSKFDALTGEKKKTNDKQAKILELAEEDI